MSSCHSGDFRWVECREGKGYTSSGEEGMDNDGDGREFGYGGRFRGRSVESEGV